MEVRYNDLRPSGFAVQFKLANGWTISFRQRWGDDISVLAWPTGTDTSVAGHVFTALKDVENAQDVDVPALIAEVAALLPAAAPH